MEWYYSKNSVQHGPVGIETLRAMLAERSLGAEELVWHDGMADWTPVTGVADLASAIPADSAAPYAPPAAPGTSVFPPVRGAKATSGLAIASLVCGILGITSCTFFPGIFAVIFGHLAMRRTDPANGDQGGRGLVVAGLVLGYISLALIVIFGIMVISTMIKFNEFAG